MTVVNVVTKIGVEEWWKNFASSMLVSSGMFSMKSEWEQSCSNELKKYNATAQYTGTHSDIWYPTTITFNTEEDFTAFLLRWA